MLNLVCILEAGLHLLWQIGRSPLLSGFIGVLVGGLITYWIQRTLERRRTFNRCADEFTLAFFDELLAMANRDRTDNLHCIIEDSLAKHFRAVARFRAVFKGKQLKDFDRAWQDYAGDRQVQWCLSESPPFPLPSLDQYHDRLFMPKDAAEREEAREEVIRKLERLLAFAKPK